MGGGAVKKKKKKSLGKHLSFFAICLVSTFKVARTDFAIANPYQLFRILPSSLLEGMLPLRPYVVLCPVYHSWPFRWLLGVFLAAGP